jgi:methionine synthase II (cobalamin-independent)
MFTPFITTGIGSLPHTDPYEACRLVLDTFDIPFWPQLPRLSFREFMIPQFSEGMPFLKIDEQRETLWIGEDGDDLSRFYETYSDDLKMPISESYAKGLHAFRHTATGRHFHYLKGHITGPLTFTLGLKDSRGRPIYYDEELREISLMLLQAKIRWQIDILKPYADQVIIFIDEPVLSALGSSTYLGVAPKEALRLLRAAADTIKGASALSGIHCCSKADWPLVIDCDVSIISFDAYDYIEAISLYSAEFTAFLKNNGYLAWGIVPTTEAIQDENTESVKHRFERGIDLLSKSIPAELLLSQILLTPSCGTGSRSLSETQKIFRILSELSSSVKGQTT